MIQCGYWLLEQSKDTVVISEKNQISIRDSWIFLLIKLLCSSWKSCNRLGQSFAPSPLFWVCGALKAFIVIDIKVVLLLFFSFLFFSRKQKKQSSWASSTSTVCTSSQLHYWPTPQRKNLAKVLNTCEVCVYMCWFWKYNIEMNAQVFYVAYYIHSSVRWFSNIAVAGLDFGVVDILCWAPHLSHQELHHQ